MLTARVTTTTIANSNDSEAMQELLTWLVKQGDEDKSRAAARFFAIAATVAYVDDLHWFRATFSKCYASDML